MLTRDPNKRLGYINDAEDIKKHAWFETINWEDAFNRKLKPPQIVPQDFSDDPMEISRFNNENELSSFDSRFFENWDFNGEEGSQLKNSKLNYSRIKD